MHTRFTTMALIVCAVAMVAGVAFAQPAIVNGDFQADAWDGQNGNGYRTTITGWTKSGDGSWGLNQRGGPLTGKSGPPPSGAGNGHLFIQGSAPTTVSQNLSGWEDYTRYQLSFLVQVRDISPGMFLEVKIGNKSVYGPVSHHYREGWREVNIPFRYIASEMNGTDIKFVSSWTGADTTILIDRVRLGFAPNLDMYALMADLPNKLDEASYGAWSGVIWPSVVDLAKGYQQKGPGFLLDDHTGNGINDLLHLQLLEPILNDDPCARFLLGDTKMNNIQYAFMMNRNFVMTRELTFDAQILSATRLSINMSVPLNCNLVQRPASTPLTTFRTNAENSITINVDSGVLIVGSTGLSQTVDLPGVWGQGGLLNEFDNFGEEMATLFAAYLTIGDQNKVDYMQHLTAAVMIDGFRLNLDKFILGLLADIKSADGEAAPDMKALDVGDDKNYTIPTVPNTTINVTPVPAPVIEIDDPGNFVGVITIHYLSLSVPGAGFRNGMVNWLNSYSLGTQGLAPQVLGWTLAGHPGLLRSTGDLNGDGISVLQSALASGGLKLPFQIAEDVAIPQQFKFFKQPVPTYDPLSANGYCGSVSPGGCYNDEDCIYYGDCCEDVCDYCNDAISWCDGENLPGAGNTFLFDYGTQITFDAFAEFDPEDDAATYQWFVGTTAANLQPVGPPTSEWFFDTDFYSFGDQTRRRFYQVRATASVCGTPSSIFSNLIEIVGGQPPALVVTGATGGGNYLPGQTATLGVSATCTAGLVNATYQWQKYDGANWVSLAGATSPTLILNTMDYTAAGDYRCVVTNQLYATIQANPVYSVISATATINMPPVIGISEQPQGANLLEDDDLTLTVVADVAEGTLEYEWQVNTGGEWLTLPGATDATYDITVALMDDAGTYRVVVTNDHPYGEYSLISATANVTVTEGAAGLILRVDPTATGAQDGSTWEDAFHTLQAAINAADAQGGGEVWVAGSATGVYYSENRTEPWGNAEVVGSLVMKNNVKLYGGFEGYRDGLGAQETDRYQRNRGNWTYIDGSTARDGLPAYHVVVFGSEDAPTVNALLDGFAIIGGDASGVADDYHTWRGGGIYNYQSSPTIANCWILDNSAAVSGGGIANEPGPVAHANARIVNTVFSDNVALRGNDAYLGASGTNVRGGGAIFNNSNGVRRADVTMDFVTIADNQAGNPGYAAWGNKSAGVYTFASLATMMNSIVWGNEVAPGLSGTITHDSNGSMLSDTTVIYSIVQSSTYAAAATFNQNDVNALGLGALYGNAHFDAAPDNWHLRLTANAQSQTGSWSYQPPVLTAFTATYTQYIGGGTGADGMAFVYQANANAAFGETGSGGQGLVVSFLTWDGTTGSPDWDLIRVSYNGANISQAGVAVPPGLRSADWKNVVISVEANGHITVSWGGTEYVNTTIPGWNPQPSWYMGLGARTGGSYDLHAVSNFSVSSGAATVYPGAGNLNLDPGWGIQYAPLEGSPAIDAAHPASLVADDIGGKARPIGPLSDMGAWEFKPRPVITIHVGDKDVDPQIVVECSIAFELPEATAVDYYGNPVPVIISDLDGLDVDNPAVGTYFVVYSAADPEPPYLVAYATLQVDVVDTTIPELALLGDDPQIIECGDDYIELGAVATDTCDDDVLLTDDIVIDASDVNVGAVGVYTVTYNVTDSEGNEADEITRTVEVIDTTIPVLALVGDDPQVIECSDPYVELGALATDNCDDDAALTALIVIDASEVDTGIVGVYTVTYNVSDAEGNEAEEITRTVEVVDTTAPVITLVGDAVVNVECMSAYTELGATALDACDGDLTAEIAIGGDVVDPNVLGVYVITYSVVDAEGNDALETRTVNVVDTTPPVLQLIGFEAGQIFCNGIYFEAGAIATDICAGDISGSIVIDGVVDTSLPGIYVLTYNVSDPSANAAVPVTRTITVTDTVIPVITLTGGAAIEYPCGTAWVDPGYVGADLCYGDLTDDVVIGGDEVNTALPGVYVVTYDLTDPSDNVAVQKTRTVTVVGDATPVITLNGDAELDVECGSLYVDAGATAFVQCYGDLTEDIVVGGDVVNTAVLGVYVITYNVTDPSDNVAEEVTRTVTVVGDAIPAITLNGDAELDVECGDLYEDAGATAFVQCYGDLTDDIVVAGDVVDPNSVGVYVITYNVTDPSDNAAAEVTRTVNVVDTTAPVIALNGDAELDIECGAVYEDAGATAADACDGDLTGDLVVGGDVVDTSVVGVYVITYNVADASAIAAEEVTRTVTVVDTTAPVITLLGDNPQTVNLGDAYIESGATAADVCDGDLTAEIIIDASAVNTDAAGVYQVTYNVSDASANAADEVVRTVNVTSAPFVVAVFVEDGHNVLVIYNRPMGLGVTDPENYVLSGSGAGSLAENPDSVALVVGSTYRLTWLCPALMLDGGDITITVDASVQRNNGTPMTEPRTGTAIGAAVANIPVIALLGDEEVTVECGAGYVDAGVSAIDDCSSDLTDDVVVGGDVVDAGTVGVYVVTYNLTDAAGNVAVEVTRTVTVEDTTPPVIALIGDAELNVECGDDYVDAGATASDVCDGDLTDDIVVVGADVIDTAVVGQYIITYNVTDSQNLDAVEVIRTVNVVDTTPPVITLLGDAVVDVECGGSYTDAGAIAADACDGDLTAEIAVGGDVVDPAVVGQYIITYNVADSATLDAAEVIRTVNVVDTTVPVITLLGDAEVDVECGDGYVDAGATAADVCDGDLTGEIEVGGDVVDANVVGVYVITYNVADAEANAAVEVTRTVTVADTTIPAITLLGDAEVDVDCGDDYVDAGATAADVCDGDLTAEIVVGGDVVDINQGGVYIITYNVSDASDNAAIEVTRTVTVIDETAPVITLLGDAVVDVECGSVYEDAGATADDDCVGDLTGSIVVGGDVVDTSAIGAFTITYNVSDGINDADEVTRTVNVVDTTAPVITLIGDAEVDVECGDIYVDAGATAADVCDGDLTEDIVVGGDVVLTSVVGTYEVTFNVADAEANAAVEVVRTVNVVDTTAPVITLIGDADVDVDCGDTYVDAGAEADDVCDGDLTGDIAVGGDAVDTATVGVYVITYNVEDAEGNAAVEVTRTVNVVDATTPVITLLGDAEVYVDCGDVFVDDGATAADECYGDLTDDIVVGGDVVDINQGGVYVITYNVSDGSSNAAVEVTRTVTVVDETAPVITLLGDASVDVECGSIYVDAGAEADDDCVGDLTAEIVVGGDAVDTAVVGAYIITYNVSDGVNDAEEVTRTVNVVDTTAPVIALVGDAAIDVECGSIYADAGATAADVCDGDLTANIIIDASAVDTAVLGAYEVTFNVADAEGNDAVEVIRTVNVVDTTAPVITLIGDAEVDVECTGEYIEAGATAADVCEGDLTDDIVIAGDVVDPDVVGVYVITYNVTDGEANAAVEVTRTVNVVDTTIPVITLLGDAEVEVDCGDVFVDDGATAADVCDGDLTAEIVVGGDVVDTNQGGVYIITYNVSDASDNAAVEVTRTVEVIDLTAPVITLLGDAVVDVECGDEYVDAGAEADDDCVGDLTAEIVVGGDAVDTAVVGVYTITYNVSDGVNDADEVTRTVNVLDTTIPVITLLGLEELDIECGVEYVDAGATAADICDGDLTGDIEVDGAVDAGTVGQYILTYNVSDASDNAAVEVTRTVNVLDTTIPVITLLGNAEVTLQCSAAYVDAGATAADVCSGDLTAEIVVVNDVDTGNVGEYIITYNVVDGEGLAAVEVTRTVNVVDTISPVITVLGALEVVVECNDVYTDAGAVASDLCDGDMTDDIVTDNPVNVGVPGLYTITYNVTDGAGKEAREKTRTVTVVDTLKPVLTLLGDAVVTLDCGDAYTDAGATAIDICDGDMTSQIVMGLTLGNPVTPGVAAVYTLTYRVTDASGNEADPVVRTVNVLDATAPVITLLGDAEVTTECGGYVDAGATAFDLCSGDITSSIVVNSNVDASIVGGYLVTYNVSDAAGNAATQVTRTVNVVDTTPPVIALVGDAVVEVDIDTEYEDAGATASDVCDGDLTAAIVVGGDVVDISVAGEYVITYNVSDSHSNAAVEVTRTVNVVIPLDAQLLVDPLVLLLGAYGEWTVTVIGGTGSYTYAWYRDVEEAWVPVVNGPFGDGEYDGADTDTLIISVFVEEMAGDYKVEVSDGVDTVEAIGTIEVGAGVPAASALGLAALALAAALGGVAALRRRK